MQANPSKGMIMLEAQQFEAKPLKGTPIKSHQDNELSQFAFGMIAGRMQYDSRMHVA